MTDLRSIHFHEIAATLDGKRLLVHEALRDLGEANGSELANRLEWTVLSVRPRLSECYKAGLAEKTDHRRNGEHVFAYVSAEECLRRKEVAEAQKQQLVLFP